MNTTPAAAPAHRTTQFSQLTGRQLIQGLAQGFKRLPNLRLFAWLAPATAVDVLHADGSRSRWVGDATHANHTAPGLVAGKPANFSAIALPEDSVLRRQLALPQSAATDIAQAVELEAHAVSPFKAEDLIWGHASQNSNGQLMVDIALTSRQTLDQQVSAISALHPPVSAPEVWALAEGQSQPIVFPGFGEARRSKHATTWRWVRMLLLVLAIGLAAGAAVTPSLQLRERAIEAVAAYTTLAKNTTKLLQQRESLSLAMDQIAELENTLKDRIPPVQAMALITQALPDDTSVLTLQVQGTKVKLTGQTPNAAALMKRLSAEPWIRDVQAPQAATRPLGSNKDSFSIDFDIHTAALASKAPEPAAVASAASASAPVAATPSPSTPVASSTTAALPAPVASNPVMGTGGKAKP